MITTLKTATQFALSLASQLQNAQDNATVLADASAWHDLADDLRKLVVYADSRAAALDADADEVSRYKPEGAVLYDGTPGSGSTVTFHGLHPDAPAGLTDGEFAVWQQLRLNAEDCSGGDFAITEEVTAKQLRHLGLTKQQFGALLTTLQAKGHISVHVTYVNGDYRSKGTKVTQVSFHPRLHG